MNELLVQVLRNQQTIMGALRLIEGTQFVNDALTDRIYETAHLCEAMQSKQDAP